MSSDFWSKERYSSLTLADSSAPERVGIKLSGPTPAWLEMELPGLGILVTVTPEDELLGLPGVDADVDGIEAMGRAAAAAAAEEEPVLGVAGSAATPEPVKGDDKVVGAGDARPDAVGRYFLLDRSTEPDDCHDRL